ncbi:sensor histidine kinase [Mucilaginibacter sp. AW1-7]|jgi:LytS/YehU family sensor histidine kinase|uniref:sensor histidine kinase n=1 Tax=Mucilaginibacter sp. AW1-7 TaxID=3349874 RepID=UPI003F739816
MWSKPGYLYKFGVQNTFRGLYFLVFSTLYWAFLRFIAYRKNVNEKERLNLVVSKEKAELENKLADVRNAYLQHQINPHLLFNTLNFIYNKVYQNSESASECVFLLAEIMRYSLKEADESGKKLLEMEVEQIDNLIKINRLRYNHPLYINFIVTGRFTGVKIIPLILLTFVENVFKHGNLKIEEDKATMELNVNENNELTFTTRNIKKQQNPNDRLKSIGVENAIKRLSYNYPDQYKLNIYDEEGTFNLYLYMRL